MTTDGRSEAEYGAARRASPMVHLGLLAGLLAPLLWAATITIAGELRPGFDHFSQYISELGERGSSTEIFMRYAGFVTTGFMHLGYAAAFHGSLIEVSAQRRLTLLVALLIGLNGLGRIGAGVFACEPGCAAPEVLSQHLHHLAASIAFLALAMAAILASLLFRTDDRLRNLAAYSFASGGAGLFFLWLMSSGAAAGPYPGLYERLASGVLTLWIFVGALRLRRVLVAEK
ncbi:MAG: hypothetical protein H6R15_3065 [Proteobacteria bacterium]|nr:hypothetical protein [Pseudomonadota bacterium]